MYIGAKGRLKVFLLDALRIVNGRGERFDQGELLRWLAESVWFPTNFLQDENKQWFPVDSKNARLKVNVNGMDLNYLVSFNERGEISTLSTKRYMAENLETWIISFSGYSDMNSTGIPLLAEASWKIDGKMFPYGRFEVWEIEYDIAMPYL